MGQGEAWGSPVGRELAGYRIVALLGRGATSSVYRARELRLEREVALKLLSPELSRDRRFRRRFERESKAAASLQHPNIVPVYAAGEVEGQLYIAMRLVEGCDLKALLRRERLGAERALATCAQLAAALDAAHANGLVHRDVKPSNVLIEQEAEGEEHVYLTDFGLTKTAAPGSRATETGQLLGTIDYMAPEQIQGKDVDGRADLYSLGCLLYECLVGEPPFSRGSDVATIFAHLREPPPSASERKPVLPQAIDAVLARALAKEPEQRYATGAELVEAAREALGLPAEASSRPWRRRRRRRLALVAGAAAAVGAATAGTLALAGGGHGTAAPIHQRVALPGYRVTATHRVTNGAPGVRPIVGLIAATDNGEGSVSTKLSLRPTGELVFRFDSGLLESGVGDSAVNVAAGTRIGYYVNWTTAGGSFVQFPVVVTGTSTDPKTASHVLHAVIRWTKDYWPITGRQSPVTIRQTGSEFALTFNLQKIVRRSRAVQGGELNYLYSGFFLTTFVNPLESSTFHGSVAARPCLDPGCARMGTAASDRIAFELPKDLTVRAPARAVYGKPATFTGTGVSGEIVTMARSETPGRGPPCTPATPRWCAPRFGPGWIGNSDYSTTVASDGIWSLAVPMHPKFVEDWLGLTGRWTAVEASDRSLGRESPLFTGASVVLAEAPADTVVSLAKPSLALERRGDRLAVRIAVDGGDSSVHYTLRIGGKHLDQGHLLADGAVVAEIAAPKVSGPLEATVSRRGVESASASVPFRAGR
jgi:tRNA A-37 threonylcarbamoyl transferase component Bud32